jgi:hypothetical protein
MKAFKALFNCIIAVSNVVKNTVILNVYSDEVSIAHSQRSL